MTPAEQEALRVLAASQYPYFRVLAELASLHAAKSADYNDHGVKLHEYFPFGLTSYVQMLWVKMLRIRSVLGSTTKNESMKDSLRDLANYTIFALMRNDE